MSNGKGGPHLGSTLEEFLEEEGLTAAVQAGAEARIDTILKNQQMRICIAGPIGIGKTIIAERIERMLKEEFNAVNVTVADHVQQEKNAMNIDEWRASMSENLSKVSYHIDEVTVL